MVSVLGEVTSELHDMVEQLTQEAGEWQDYALCAQTDPEAFFPEKGGSTRDAKKICRRCTVREECLEFAIVNQERFGIWGGMSERERRRLAQQYRQRKKNTRVSTVASSTFTYDTYSLF